MNSSHAKKAAAERAVSYVQNGMIIGLGTGSTANFAIELIGQKVRNGLKIVGVPTSIATEQLAKTHGIPLLETFARIDLTIDGADEVDPHGNLIKGGGGALTREKIVAAASEQEIIVVDSSKLVEALGEFPLPLEVLPFGCEYLEARLTSFGCKVSLRKLGNENFLTDNGNHILDCQFKKISDPENLHSRLNNLPGVVENGLFVGLADLLIVGKEDGRTEERRF